MADNPECDRCEGFGEIPPERLTPDELEGATVYEMDGRAWVSCPGCGGFGVKRKGETDGK